MPNDEEASAKAAPSGKQAKQPAKKKKSATAVSPPTLRQPTTRTENFLVIEVPRGATRQQLVQAVDRALTANEVPFFKDRQQGVSAPGSPSQPGDPASPPPSGSKSLRSGLGPDEALLLFVKEEGMP